MSINKLAIGIAIFGISIGIWGGMRGKKCNDLITILNQKDKLISDGYDEMIMQTLQAIKEQNLELARNQGRLEGIILTAQKLPPNDDDASGIWHAGYNRGLEQKEYTDKMYKDSKSPFKSK